MSLPHTRVEIWGAVNIKWQLNDEAESIHIKETLTDAVGTFSFLLPNSKDGANDFYSDVVLNDKAKVWINWDSIAGDPLTVGPICQTQASPTNGLMRCFLCKNQGEVLTRRFKTKNYVATDASTIVAEWAADLSLGTSFTGDASDAYHESFFVDHESYFDCLRLASDFWVSAGVVVKKDFFVDIGDVGHPTGHLVWKTRPIRTAGVETLTYGTNIDAYTVQRDETAVKNYLWIYGKLGKIEYDLTSKMIADGRKNPADGDSWTESTDDWTCVHGTLTAPDTDPVVGTHFIHCVDDTDAVRKPQFYVTKPVISVYGLEGYQTLNFWLRFSDAVTYADVKIMSDGGNYFTLVLPSGGYTPTDWTRYSFILGDGNVYNAVSNPSGQWTVGGGTPDWHKITMVYFYCERAGIISMHVDGLYFGHGRWRSIVQDAVVSQPAYGIREMVHVDDKLESDSQCQMRGESLLWQFKDAPTRLDVTTPLNLNIKIGDRLTMTLAPEHISAVAYDVVTVEHFIDKQNGARTKATMLNSSDAREVPIQTTTEAIIKEHKRILNVNRGVQNRW
ncbi:hypothetical protein MUO83_07825 [Candidatus Bathyarchaeota archaeon]|nr:hypothetical protein [Candidatus Bathyarchaeota archaeon]